MKLDWQWPAAMVFSLVFASLAVLVYFGKVHGDALFALLAWLIPSPIQKVNGETKPAQADAK